MPALLSEAVFGRAIRFGALAMGLALPLVGCATAPPASDPEARAEFRQMNDPLEPTNRVIYGIDDALDAVLLKPAALAYVNVVPAAGRTGLHNVLRNLSSPVVLANDALQGSASRSGNTLERFAINSTVGVAGIFDVAATWGIPGHSTDFGTTLALWGVGEGPYLYLPVLGPSNPRDATGYGVDTALDPFTYIGKGSTVTDLRYTRLGLYAVDERASVLGALAAVKKGALDPYATVRSLYRQSRESDIAATAAAEHRAGPRAPGNSQP